MKKWSGLYFRVVVLLGMVTIPVTVMQAKKKPEPQPTNVKLSVQVPSLAPLAETEQSQTKGGLRITLTPETYQAKESMAAQRRQLPPPMFSMKRDASYTLYVERTMVPQLKIVPERLVLHVHLSNQMPRVFRGSGIAVQFNVAGKIAAVDPSGYGDFINIILPPRSDQEITILGPLVSTILAPCTVGVMFYDVVTNMDQSGNVTEKQNFEWYFSYQTQLVEKEFTVPPPVRGWEQP